jgi:uncharacterized protein (DUF1015 family)
MADIVPFQAFRYNPQYVSPAQAVTQPYDKISPAMQEQYYAASPYNLVRIILGRREAGDNTEHNVYTRAAGCFRDWRGRGVLRQDPAPSIYACAQRFAAPGTGTQQERLGFIALGRIEDYSAKVVYRHEQTLAKPKADRLELLRATRAHFEQLFVLYEDSGEIDSLLAGTVAATPTIEVTDEYGVLHRVWQISDSQVIDSVRSAMRDKKLVIADGHHRYETALNYRDERRRSREARSTESSGRDSASGSGFVPCEFAVMTFVNMNSPGLLILPAHRVVHSLDSFSVGEFAESSRALFDVEEVDPGLDAARGAAMLREKGSAGTALLAVAADRAFILRNPKQGKAAAQALANLSERQQALDVVQLHKCLLEGVLGLSEESIRNQQNISYVRDAAEAIERVRTGKVRTGKANVAFLMNPCKVEQVRDVAFASELMPQKSTDFYPKLLSGLTIYALD